MKIVKAKNQKAIKKTNHPYPSGNIFFKMLKKSLGKEFLIDYPLIQGNTLISKYKHKKNPSPSQWLNQDPAVYLVVQKYVEDDLQNLLQQEYVGFLCNYDIQQCEKFLHGRTFKSLYHQPKKHYFNNKARVKVYNFLISDPVGLHPNVGNWKTLKNDQKQK